MEVVHTFFSKMELITIFFLSKSQKKIKNRSLTFTCAVHCDNFGFNEIVSIGNFKICYQWILHFKKSKDNELTNLYIQTSCRMKLIRLGQSSHQIIIDIS